MRVTTVQRDNKRRQATWQARGAWGHKSDYTGELLLKYVIDVNDW
ncbi:hypothetical protein DFP86_109185 [Paludibacterium purpuratum]|uniref:Uncharacterized protein n=1 Tax=Paludibacterium purpuratum TaxID=1144873 RepID=A0A4V3DUX2_9NEIS|nr:hypothetical protein DFP86_109185 [Paludibacterium purpuratum]